jgi:hypothetical protein
MTETLEFTAKATPKKLGMFVSIWQRSDEGTTIPQSTAGDWEYMVIRCEQAGKQGYFNFPKDVLLQHKIISNPTTPDIRGKNGMRVYPSWVTPTNSQAITTQKWQVEYFIQKVF